MKVGVVPGNPCGSLSTQDIVFLWKAAVYWQGNVCLLKEGTFKELTVRQKSTQQTRETESRPWSSVLTENVKQN